jgi:16S rRNA (uracil1498-N3)-methyltransferase
MRLTRVHVDGPLVKGEQQLLEGAAANHITRVLRLRSGDALTLFNGDGGEYSARVVEFRKDSVLVAVGELKQIDRESPLSVTLAQGVSRGERMDWIIQKVTELGASRIVPVFTERSVVRLDAKQAERKVQHWRGIVIAACEQSGRNRVPDLGSPIDVFEFLGSVTPDSVRLLLSPSADSRIEDLQDVTPEAGITLLIGPEGGLTEVEQESAVRAGFRPVRLGPRVLRTETAAIAALTLIQHRFGDL